MILSRRHFGSILRRKKIIRNVSSIESSSLENDITKEHHRNSGVNTLIAACGAHAIQDGMVAVQYVLLPVLAQALGLSYTQVGLLRASSGAAMALLEIPSGFLAEKYGERRLLCLGLIGAGIGYAGVASSSQFVAVCLFFLLVGGGAAFQHSLSSSLLVRQFAGGLRRKALGTYNAFGDLGKLAYAGAFSVLLGLGLTWNATVLLLGCTAIFFGLTVWWLLRHKSDPHRLKEESRQTKNNKRGNTWGITQPGRFLSLGITVFLDSIVQAAFLTFVAFVLVEKGASASHAAGGVVLTLIGGTAGKFAGGLLAAKMGDRRSFFIIQWLTVAALLGVLFLPLQAIFIILPLAGVFIQGSSTVCYGTVADYVDESKSSRAYSIIYTLSSTASVAGPFILGVLADQLHIEAVLWSLIIVTVLTIIFGFSLSGKSDS